MKSFWAFIVAFSCLMGSGASAAPLIVHFAFANVDEPQAAQLVTGVVRGLVSNGDNQAATSVEVLSNASGYGVGEYIGAPNQNSWTIVDGEITSFVFQAFGNDNTAPAVTDSSLWFGFNADGFTGFFAGLSNNPGGVGANGLDTIGLDVQIVPLPAGLVLMASALLLLGTTARRMRSA